ncbi:MAG: alpha/beta hydrolase [Hyphomicrobiales bacterium]
MQIFLKFVGLLCLALGLAFVFGPREPFDGEVTFDQASIGDDLDQYLVQQENKFSDIRQGLNKQIIWHGERGAQTDIAIVYLHGFSASSAEVQPVPDQVAKALGANLYYTRLKGHGRTAEAMAEANADDWLNDAAEALAIGARLGKKLIVVSTSTGGSLAAYLHAHKPEWGDMIAGHVMISPNFGLADPTSALLSFPFARQFVPLILGPMRGRASSNRLVQHVWTIPHATSALMPLARITNEANEAPLENIDVPTLVFRSLQDKTVSPKATASAINRIGGTVEQVLIDQSGHRNHHVLAGDAVSPRTNGLVTTTTVEWIKRLK